MGEFLEEKSTTVITETEFKLVSQNVGSKDFEISSLASKCRQSTGESKDLWRVVLALAVQVQTEKERSAKLIGKIMNYAAAVKPESSKAINCILLSDCVQRKISGVEFVSPQSADFLQGLDMYPLIFTIVHNMRKKRLLGDTIKLNAMAWKHLLASIYFKLLPDKTRFHLITYQGSRPRSGMLNVISEGNYQLTEMIISMILHFISKHDGEEKEEFELHITNTIQEALKECRRCVDHSSVARKGQDKKDLNFYRYLVGEPMVIVHDTTAAIQKENLPSSS